MLLKYAMSELRRNRPSADWSYTESAELILAAIRRRSAQPKCGESSRRGGKVAPRLEEGELCGHLKDVRMQQWRILQPESCAFGTDGGSQVHTQIRQDFRNDPAGPCDRFGKSKAAIK